MIKLSSYINISILSLVFIHIIFYLGLDTNLLNIFHTFLNIENIIVNIDTIISFSKKTYEYIPRIIAFLVLISFIVKGNYIINLFGFFYVVLFYIYNNSIFIKISLNKLFFILSYGEFLVIIFYSICLYLFNSFFKLLFIKRTDEEILETGMNRIPNTINILIFGIITAISFSIIILAYILFFTRISNITYSIITIISILYIVIFIKSNYISDLLLLKKAIKHQNNDIIIRLRNKHSNYFGSKNGINLLNQHEYRYSQIGFANISDKIHENTLTKLLTHSFQDNKIKLNDIEKTIKEEVSINERNGQGFTIFLKHSADLGLLYNSKKDFNQTKQFQILSLLIKYGADPNIENFMGRDALNFAINYEYFDLVKFLLKNGSLIKTKSNQSPLLYNDHLKQALENRNSDIYHYLKSYNEKSNI